MTFSSFILILQRQLTQKWGRFLLASGGIMIGIWAISLTTSLSLGVSQAIVQAINSQPFAREITISKTESNQTSYLQVKSAPKFVPITSKDLSKIVSDHSEILEIGPDVTMNFDIHTKDSNANTQCVEQSLSAVSATSPALSNTTTTVPLAGCINTPVSYSTFSRFYDSNKKDWVGSTNQPQKGEVVVCYKCGDKNLGENLGAANPSDLIGKTITIELQRAPDLYPVGKVLDVQNFNAPKTGITTSKSIDLKVTAVIDDRSASTFGGSPFYLDYSYYTDAFKQANPEYNPDDYAALQNTVFIKSYQDLDKTVAALQKDGYLTLSIAQVLIGGVNTGFLVLSVVLSLLGFIALIASVFGIINVMAISVLERQKEIGVLKSLGARDSDIFNIFLLESALLGFIGWLIGTLLAVLMGNIISVLFIKLVYSNPDWKSNLDSLNLTSFSPTFPWWLLLGTLGVALFFTVLSGVFPAIKAAKQNPVEVLRSE